MKLDLALAGQMRALLQFQIRVVSQTEPVSIVVPLVLGVDVRVYGSVFLSQRGQLLAALRGVA